jgi:hypothetical protein
MCDIFTDTKLIRELIHMDFPEIEPVSDPEYDSDSEDQEDQDSELYQDALQEQQSEPQESVPKKVILEKVLDESAKFLKEVKDDNYAKIVKVVNYHIKAFAQFVDNKYFEEIYSQFKTESEMKILKDLSQTVFEITDSEGLVKFIEFAKSAEKIMNETDGLPRFGKSFSECFVWHIEELIEKLNQFIASKSI